MEKNTVIAIILSTLVIVLGFTLQAKLFPPQETAQAAPRSIEMVNEPVPEETLSGDTALVTAVDDTVITNEADSAATETIDTEEDAKNPVAEARYTIETDLVRVIFTNRGGDVVSYQLKEHRDNGDPIEMAYSHDDNRAFSLVLGQENGKEVDELFNVRKISDTAIGFYRTFSVRNADGTTSNFTLVKQYSFAPDDYLFELKVTIDGDETLKGLQFGNAAYSLRTSPQIGPEWDQKQDRYEYRKFYYLLDGKKKTVTLNQGNTKSISSRFTWSAMAGKYFTIVALPEMPIQGVTYSTISEDPKKPVSQMILVRAPVTGRQVTDTWRFYLGPRTERELARYNVATNNPYLLTDARLNEMVESSGILAPLEFLLKAIMELFYKMIPNWGISILLMTILMRIVIFPLTKKSTEATLKMQEHAPKMQEIQAKYKNDPKKLNEEMAKFYQASGYNPLSGCLPLVIQFPLIFAMYNLFNNYFEFRGAMFIPGWIPDLSRGDSLMQLPFLVPIVNWGELRLLPIIYVVSQLLFSKVTQTPTATAQKGSMKFMMYGMPLMFFFLFYNAPAGLLLYWTFSNILTLGQQVVINKMMHAKKELSLVSK